VPRKDADIALGKEQHREGYSLKTGFFRSMAIEIINTGSELMIGRVLNTHHQWLCAQLDELGYTVHRQVSVSDESSAIVDAVQESLGRSNAVILTGGLGPPPMT
jgi:nicotinamide-nucleotide amidase